MKYNSTNLPDSSLEQIAHLRAQYTFLTIVLKRTVNNSQKLSKLSESTFTRMTTSNHMQQKMTHVRPFLKRNIEANRRVSTHKICFKQLSSPKPNPSRKKDNQTDIVGVLGVKWNLGKVCFLMKPLTDFPNDASAYTQRKIFSLVSSIFEPIEIMSPSTIRFKIVLQELGKLGKKWDEQIAPQVVKPLQRNLDIYFSSPEVTLNRTLYKSCHSQESEIKVHIFVDASAVAVAAVA